MFSLYSDVTVTPVEWLWYPYIALGKITVLQGDPGDGKSTMMMHLISSYRRMRQWYWSMKPNEGQQTSSARMEP